MQNILRSQSSCAKGFTLTEIAVVLGIIGLVLGSVWVAARNVYQNTLQAQAEQSLSQLVANVRAEYGQAPPPNVVDISQAFSQITFQTSKGPQPASVISIASIAGTPAGFAITMNNWNNTVNLSTTFADQAVCRGFANLVNLIEGSYTYSQSGVILVWMQGCTCTTTGPSAPPVAGYTVGTNSCVPGPTPSGSCQYIETSVCTPVGNTLPISLYVPWSQ